MRFLSILAPLAAAALLAGPADAVVATAKGIVPHRAVYDISLGRSDEGSGVTTAAGRMVFEITGSACAGYSMKQRMVVNIGDEEGNLGLLDFRIRTFETGNGDRYDFDAKTTVNDDVVEAVKGEARRKGAGGVEVKLKAPGERTVTLDPSILFPSQHLHAILTAAAADRTFVAAEIYEGAGKGDTSDAASASIGKALLTDAEGPLRGGVRHWPVSVGYFDRTPDDKNGLGEELPSYQMRFTLYENGVTNDLVMDYGKYALLGSLKEIEPLAAEGCPAH